MSVSAWLAMILIASGVLFFFAGAVGLMRFPDLYTRLHALTKADNVGLGLIVAGLIVLDFDWIIATKLILIWILVMLASANGSYLIARTAHLYRIRPWRHSR